MNENGAVLTLTAVGAVAVASVLLGRRGSKSEVPRWMYFKRGKWVAGSGDSPPSDWDRAEWWYEPMETYVYVTPSNPSSPIHQYGGPEQGVIPDWVRQTVKRHPPR